MADDPVTSYAKRIASGDLPAGKWHRLACERHLKDLEESQSGNSQWKFRFDLAAKAFGIFALCRHFKGEWGGKFIVLEPWQQFIVGSIMGWVNKDTNLRRFRNSFIELPRGQGKSTMAGGMLLIFAFFDNEPGAECYSVATKKDQARIVFEYARQMALRSPKSIGQHVSVSKYAMHNEASESRALALGADADTLDGLRPSFVCADEVHRHPSAALIEVMESGMGTRLQPHLMEITTAGEDDQSIYGQHHLLSTRILERTVDLDEWFCFMASADPEDDWTLETTWIKANPNYGISVKPETIRKDCNKALANPAAQAGFRRLHLGQKVQTIEGYFSLDDWKACPELPEQDELRKYPCWIGLDLSSSIDVTAAVLVWKLPNDEIAVEPHFWLPADNLDDRSHRDRVPYGMYVPNHLTLTEGNTIDRPTVRREVARLAKLWKAKAVCYDPWHAPELVQALQDEDGIKCTPIPQGYQMLSPAMKDLQALILKRRIRHDRNPLMTIMVSNVVPRWDEKGNVMPSKKRSRGRIDGVQATLDVLALISREQIVRPAVFFLGGNP